MTQAMLANLKPVQSIFRFDPIPTSRNLQIALYGPPSALQEHLRYKGNVMTA